MEVYWMSHVPAKDDFDAAIDDEFIDGATLMGPWAIMTPANHARVGRGLGTGVGQRYQRQADGRFKKVEG